MGDCTTRICGLQKLLIVWVTAWTRCFQADKMWLACVARTSSIADSREVERSRGNIGSLVTSKQPIAEAESGCCLDGWLSSDANAIPIPGCQRQSCERRVHSWSALREILCLPGSPRNETHSLAARYPNLPNPRPPRSSVRLSSLSSPNVKLPFQQPKR